MNRTCLHWTEWEKKAKELEKKNADLEAQIEKMKMCCNCEKWRNWKEELDDISFPCSKHYATDKCTLWKLKEK